MRIKIHAEGVHLYLPIPNALLFGQFGGFLLRNILQHVQKEAPPIELTDRQVEEFQQTLREVKQVHKRLTLVDVRTQKGEVVHIIL